MKKTTIILIVLTSILLGSCAGSDVYRGSWKVTDGDGTKLEIVFSENEFTLTVDENTQTYTYSQHSVNITNSVETYGIKTGDGRNFQIHFPIGNDESKGAILDANGMPLYIISRDDYLGYEDVYGL